MKAEEIKFRCSGLGYLMTDSKGGVLTDVQKAKLETLLSKKAWTKIQLAEKEKLIYKRDNPQLSDTCKTHLIDCFVSAMYSRKEEKRGKMLDKGNEREEDSITLLSRVKKIFFKKNEEQLKNDFISGTPDLYIGVNQYADVRNAKETLDTKTSWSAHTFFRASNNELIDQYFWQGMGYMALTGALKHTVAYCLVNGTESAILSEKRRLAWKMGLIDPDSSPEYKKKCKQIEINHIYDMEAFYQENPHFEFANNLNEWEYDIPMEDRLFTITFDRDNEAIEKLYKRIGACRSWMNENLFKKEETDFVLSIIEKITV